jgi:hypothetical protein
MSPAEKKAMLYTLKMVKKQLKAGNPAVLASLTKQIKKELL